MPRRGATVIANPSGVDLMELRVGVGREGARVLTLRDVQAAGGPSFGFLAQVERGEALMGEKALRQLAAVLNLKVEMVRMAYSVTRLRANKRPK